jgi:hypothetical protein
MMSELIEIPHGTKFYFDRLEKFYSIESLMCLKDSGISNMDIIILKNTKEVPIYAALNEKIKLALSESKKSLGLKPLIEIKL